MITLDYFISLFMWKKYWHLADKKSQVQIKKKRLGQFTSNLQEYEAITRGLIKGNPSVPVQGTAEETKQVSWT